MIALQNVSKKYGSLLAVDDLNLKTDRELFVFLGPNGAGKTTTIKMMTGQLIPTSGSILIDGHDLLHAPLRAKQSFGLVSEHPFLYEKLSAVEFIDFIASVYRISPPEVNKRRERLFEIFELTHRQHDLLETFSRGMKQKVAIVAALIHDPKVLFLDEPTTGLDPKAAKNLKDLLRGLVGRGTTVFMSTHILEVAQNMCDRIGIIHRGRLIALGTLAELKKNVSNVDSLEEIFLDLTGSSSETDIDRFLQGI
jgi:ABC-2 type transport system ATP-binding protein